MEIFVQVVTSLLVAAGSAWVAARVGVRRALEQIKGERAFDRRLDWYERAIRVSMKFQYFNQGMALAIRDPDLQRGFNKLGQLSQESMETLKELQQTINESLIFAKRDMYLALKETFARFDILTKKSRKLIDAGAKEDKMAEQYESLAKILEVKTFELAESVRTMLGLDQISREDFDRDFKGNTSIT